MASTPASRHAPPVPATPHVEFRTRGSRPHGARERARDVASGLRRLADEGVLASLSMRVWEESAALDDDRRSGTRRTLTEYEVWAAKHGYSLEPGFRRRRVEPPFGGPERDVVALPLMCVAVHDDRGLRAVFPCSDADGTYTVEDALAALRAASESAQPSP